MFRRCFAFVGQMEYIWYLLASHNLLINFEMRTLKVDFAQNMG